MSDRHNEFETLGCRLNAYETDVMKGQAEEAGLENAVVVNTCAVTAEAVRKSRQAIRRLRRKHPEAKLVATGCAAQIDAAGFHAMEEVDLVVGNSLKLNPRLWRKLSADRGKATTGKTSFVEDIMSVSAIGGHAARQVGCRSRAYVQIQNGCDHRCTFCIIPYGRGNSRSVPIEAVVREVETLVDRNHQEVVLTGVDVTSWGGDLPDRPALSYLLRRILKQVPKLARLRLSSVDSIELDSDFLDVLAEDSRLMPHLHLSLQAGDNMILKRMKRRHLREDAIRFCEKARRVRPEIVFGADLIAGFPTETDAMFKKSVELINECGLTWLHVFPFSPREGTPASRMPQVAGAKVRERAGLLRHAGLVETRKYLHSQVGKSCKVLVESSRKGRTEQFAEVELDNEQPPGSIVNATIVNVSGKRLVASGENVGEPGRVPEMTSSERDRQPVSGTAGLAGV